jgi:hypothetical protein
MFRLEKFVRRIKIERNVMVRSRNVAVNFDRARPGMKCRPDGANGYCGVRVTGLEHARDEKRRALAVVLRCESKRSLLAWEEIRWRL